MEYRITLAVDHCTALMLKIFGGKLVKNSFPCCWVPFRDFCPFSCSFIYTYRTAVSEVSKVRPKLRLWVRPIIICISVKLDPFRCPARDRRSPPQRRNVAKYFQQRRWFGEKFVQQTAYSSSEVNKFTAELSFGSLCNTLSQRAY